jgi:hypothetical protein
MNSNFGHKLLNYRDHVITLHPVADKYRDIIPDYNHLQATGTVSLSKIDTGNDIYKIVVVVKNLPSNSIYSFKLVKGLTLDVNEIPLIKKLNGFITDQYGEGIRVIETPIDPHAIVLRIDYHTEEPNGNIKVYKGILAGLFPNIF